jgi:threonine dehydratase
MIHPYNDERIIAGAGTAALELIQEVGPLDCILAPVGGGGLLSGTSIATKGLCPRAKVFGAEPKNADDASRSFKTKTLQPSVNPRTIADGLRTSLGDITFRVILENVDDIVTVSENEILAAMKILWERMKLVVEPSAAVPLAALLTIRESLAQANVGVVLSGGNLELNALYREYEGTIAKE